MLQKKKMVWVFLFVILSDWHNPKNWLCIPWSAWVANARCYIKFSARFLNNQFVISNRVSQCGNLSFSCSSFYSLSVFYSQIINYEIHVCEQSFLDQHPYSYVLATLESLATISTTQSHNFLYVRAGGHWTRLRAGGAESRSWVMEGSKLGGPDW